jgi:ABC-type glycerol-3-phosphate transport system substrate-binding protein
MSKLMFMSIPLLVVLSHSLTACSPVTTGAAVQTGPKQTITATTTTVQAAEQAEVEVNDKQADVITEQADKVVVNQVSFVYLLLLALGWLLPSPNEMGRWVREFISRRRDS